MRTAAVLALLLIVGVPAAPTRAAEPAEGLEHPLVRGDLAIADPVRPARRRVELSGRWRGPRGPVFNPAESFSTLRIAGAPGEGDSGVIRLLPERWRTLGGGRGFRYRDPAGTAGGIRTIVLRMGDRGGSLRVVGGRGEWRYALDRPQTVVSATLTIGAARWCAEFGRTDLRTRGRRLRGRTRTAPTACPCAAAFESTWATIQAAIFERRGCASGPCHGAGLSGGLDLRPEAAYASLVDVPSQALPAVKRVEPGDHPRSVLWQKLAKATLGGFGDLPGAGMPNGLPPLARSELDAVAVWIRAGAPETGVVGGTEELLATCLPPPDPIEIRPPDPPAPGTGVQLHAPPWDLPAESESEVCFAVYYDFSAEVPAEHQGLCPPEWGPGKTCFFYAASDFTQDPNSHHSIMRAYRGAYDVSDPGFGAFTCHGGAQHGLACDPRGIGVPAPAGADCGPGGGCAGAAIPAVACIGFGPPDFNLGLSFPAGADSDTAPSISTVTEPRLSTRFASGSFRTLPVAGVMVFNAHAFNLTAAPATNEQWMNLYFAPPAERLYPVQELFDADDIFVQVVPPFEEREYCRTHTFEKGTRLFELFSHTHKRGKLFRVWGPGVWPPCSSFSSPPCTPEAGPPVLVTTDYSNPAYVTFDPPLALDGDEPATRTLKFCALYDNGHDDPSTVRRASTAPARSQPCDLRCLDGPQRGQLCGGNDAACDSSPGRGDGECDACTLLGGITTDDEMLILLGSYYCVEGSSCYLPPS